MAQTKTFPIMADEQNAKCGMPMKSQSAMEYLMTYGWAVLIISVTIVALNYLGVFNSANVTGTSCTAISGFTCQNPTITTSGTVTFLFGQATGRTLYNVEFECTASASGANGLPNPLNMFNSITTGGVMTVNLPIGTTGNSLVNGQTITLSTLPCYSATGSLLGSQIIGTIYSGYVYVNYTTTSLAASGTNPWVTVKVINIRTKVS